MKISWENIKNQFRKAGNPFSSQDEINNTTEFLKNTLLNTNNIIYSVDKDFNITWMNKETMEFYPDSIGEKCYKVFADTGSPCPDCFCSKAMNSGKLQQGVKHINYAPTHKGRGYWEGISLPLFDNNKAIIGALSVSQEIEDIEEYKQEQAKEDLPTISDKKFNEFIRDNFKTTFDSLHLPICITGNNLKVVFNNNAFGEIIGKSDQEIKDVLITDLLPEINDIGTQRILSIIVSGIDEQSYDFVLKRDFNEKNIKLQISPIKLSNSKIGGIVWKLLNNDNLTLLQDYSYPNTRFNNYFGIMIIDKNGKVIQWNNFLENLFSWSENELIGMPNPIISQEVISQYVSDRSSEKLEVVRKTKSGDKIDIKISLFPILNNAGEISQHVCLIENKTFEKFIQSEFKDLEERYNNIIKNFEGITFKFDSEFNPLSLSGSVLTLTGYLIEDFLTNKVKFIDIVHPDDKILIEDYMNRIQNRIKTERELELRIISKTGTVKWIHFYFQNTADEFGKIILIQGFIYNITHAKEVEEELKMSREKFRTLAMYLETAREEEKKRLALEIHDELGHALSAIKLELAWVLKKRFLRQDIMFERIRKMKEIIDTAIRKVRSISRDLRPSVLDHFGLTEALEDQAKEFQKRSAVRCRLKLDKTPLKIDEKISTAIFRIFQEILNNIAKHAKATRVDVIFEQQSNSVLLKVRDNGKGFKLEKTKNTQSLGILGMTERANAIGGELSINSVVGVGTTVKLNVPLRKK